MGCQRAVPRGHEQLKKFFCLEVFFLTGEKGGRIIPPPVAFFLTNPKSLLLLQNITLLFQDLKEFYLIV